MSPRGILVLDIAFNEGEAWFPLKSKCERRSHTCGRFGRMCPRELGPTERILAPASPPKGGVAAAGDRW
eukprot:2636322-Lingulodinium_polyedra.AAC.1